MRALVAVTLAGCWTASPRTEPVRAHHEPRRPPAVEISAAEPIATRAVPAVTRCGSSVAPLNVDVENRTSLDHHMCDAFANGAAKVAWPVSLSTASGYTIRMTLTQSEVEQRRDTIRFGCRVSMELTMNGQLVTETRDRAAVHMAGTAPLDELAQMCVEFEVGILLRRVVPTLGTHIASTGTSQPQPPPPAQPQPTGHPTP